jgi:hypothetical protein
MRKLVFVIAVAALLVLASTPAIAAQDGHRPFYASLTGVMTHEPLLDGPTAECPYGVRTHVVVSGAATHLGLATETQAFCSVMSSPTVPAGASVFVAANGDTLTATFVADCPAAGPPTPGTILSCTAEYSITGGTGRFAGATGALHGENHVIFGGIEVAEWPAWESLTGWLQY